ncbi:phage holin family protein [Altibacter sp.]|uniref:phage holin family protein n=1 Tax=Altibacter sp. TaxID=2024823 RepID=UPI000C8FA8E7|nr:phage holin family protein [Altibacter sp.]MAP55675.1 hypothetical protein [Altibacter sp.]
MAFERLTNSLDRISDKFQEYGISTAEYYKLRLFKSSMKGAISLVNLLVFGSIFLFVLLFLSVGVAFLIGNSIGTVSVGFFIVGAFYGVILMLMYAFGRKTIERKMLYKFSVLLYDEDDIPPKQMAEAELEQLEKNQPVERL